MRVALVTYALRPGGMESMLLTLAERLVAAGMAAEIITTIEPGAWFDRARAAGVPATHVAGRDRWLEVGPWRHTRRVADALRPYDVVMLHHARFGQAALPGLPRSVARIPVLHNDHPEIFRVALAHPNAWNVAVCVSEGIGARARRLAPGGPIVTIPNGVPLPGGPIAARPHDPLRLVFVGRLSDQQKNVLLLPAIIRACLGRGLTVQLEVLGTGPDRRSLEAAVDRHRVASHVVLRGQAEPAAVLAALAEADVLLMPSAFEGLPVALLEAMARGCVPVATRLAGSTADVIEHGTSGLLVEPTSAAAFAHAIAALASDPTRLAAMAVAARERIRTRYSADSMGDAYTELIRDVLRGRYPLPLTAAAAGAPPFWRADYLPGVVRSAARRLLRGPG